KTRSRARSKRDAATIATCGARMDDLGSRPAPGRQQRPWIPACAGMTAREPAPGRQQRHWIPACAGMTAHSFRSRLFEIANVLDDRLDVVVAERGAERRHRARLAILDPVGDFGVGERGACELRPLARRATAIA